METRLHPRINAVIRISSEIAKKPGQHIKLDSNNAFEASAFDISETGIGLKIKKYYLPKGLAINLSVDGAVFGLKKPIKIGGEICYCTYIDNNTYKCGVKFVDMSERHRKVISKFISANSKPKSRKKKHK